MDYFKETNLSLVASVSVQVSADYAVFGEAREKHIGVCKELLRR